MCVQIYMYIQKYLFFPLKLCITIQHVLQSLGMEEARSVGVF